ncbi:MAG: acireductone synthase [Acidimicrobiales bacterium]|nr:acireductone synthase [Acidimicrobiales bacterium]MBO0894548.1 acireductone synthase [Acidimicrobiales bacterium]
MSPFRAEWVVLDIEGTTSATEAIVGDLYRYARPRLGPYITGHPEDPEVVQAVEEVRRLAGLPGPDVEEVVEALEGWMDADQKVTPLKTLQGLIWAHGFAAGELTSQFFDDVPPALRRWHDAGLHLAVFSSGSVASQQAWFRHSPAGDLLALVTATFDTANAGPKRESASYDAITHSLESPPERTLFLSDVPAELDAAATVGWLTVGVRRPGEPNADADFGSHLTVRSFDELAVAKGD